jgi:uncharacterized protein (DUF697 family)
MSPTEQESVVTIALLAAFADHTKDEAEHTAIRRVAEGFKIDSINLATLYQKVLTKEASLATAAAGLSTPEGKSLAYEIARCVCDASGPSNAAETQFLAELSAATAVPTEAPTAPSSVADATSELEPLLLKYSVLTAALELLPQSAGSLAIVPTQMKLVYDIGQRHHVELDKNSLKDFAATLGIGAVSQVVEAGLRKLMSGLLGAVGGESGEKVGQAAGGVAGTALTFATTYALGTVADKYYASGRKIDLPTLKAEFAGLVEKAKTKQGEYAAEIMAKAKELSEKFKGMDFSKVLGGIFQAKA